MNLMLRIIPFCLLIFLPMTGFAQTSSKPRTDSIFDTALHRLEREITRAAKGAGGTVGVSAVHIESGRRVALNSTERFPMASTYKIPIAVQLLTRVDQGEIDLDQMIELRPHDFHPGSGILTALLSKPGVKLSVHNLLGLMLLVSDNSAADLLLNLAGGPEAVTARLRALGIRDMEVNRPTVRLIADSAGYPLPPETEWTPELFEKLDQATTPEVKKAAGRRFEADTRDTSTPEAMAILLEKLYRRELLKADSGVLLLDLMERSKTGKVRLKGILPSETIVAHKTGTLGGTTNDVGIITLPDDGGHISAAVFVKGSDKEILERERAIGQIARAVYDFFLFQPAPLMKP